MKYDNNLDNYKKFTLNILNYVINICETNNLKYTLYHGSLLGAVRHSGFIPWDDDIDIIMEYPDFLKLKSIVQENKHKRYEFEFPLFEGSSMSNMAKCYDRETTMKENLVNAESSLFVDIFFYIGFKKTIFYKCKILYYRIITLLYMLKCNRFIFKDLSKLKKVLHIISRFIGKKILKRQIERFYVDYDKCSYVLSSEGRLFLPKESISYSKTVSFEDIYVKIPECYDYILKVLYGKYMILPPVSKQYSHHIKYFDLNKRFNNEKS